MPTPVFLARPSKSTANWELRSDSDKEQRVKVELEVGGLCLVSCVLPFYSPTILPKNQESLSLYLNLPSKAYAMPMPMPMLLWANA